MRRERTEIIDKKKKRVLQLKERKRIKTETLKFKQFIRISKLVFILILLYFALTVQYGLVGYISKLLLFSIGIIGALFVIYGLFVSKSRHNNELAFYTKILITCFLTIIIGAGFIVVRDTIYDIPYLNDPNIVQLYNVDISYKYARYSAGHYKIQGNDLQGKTYYFSVGKFDNQHTKDKDNLIIYYLPNSHLVMKIE